MLQSKDTEHWKAKKTRHTHIHTHTHTHTNCLQETSDLKTITERSEGMGKGIPWKWKRKDSRDSDIYIRKKIDFKTKTVRRDKKECYIWSRDQSKKNL